MNDDCLKEEIKNILGESYKKVGLTEEKMVECFKEVYEEVQRENVDEKSKELLLRINLHKKVLSYLE